MDKNLLTEIREEMKAVAKGSGFTASVSQSKRLQGSPWFHIVFKSSRFITTMPRIVRLHNKACAALGIDANAEYKPFRGWVNPVGRFTIEFTSTVAPWEARHG